MSNTPVQENIRAYALDQVGAAYIMGATAVKCTPTIAKQKHRESTRCFYMNDDSENSLINS